MTVKELIEQLQNFPESTQVILMCTYNDGGRMAGGDITYIESNPHVVALWCDVG